MTPRCRAKDQATCRVHGTAEALNIRAAALLSATPFGRYASQVVEYADQLEEKIDAYICQNSAENVATLDDSKLVKKKPSTTGALKCRVHRVYHVYDAEKAQRDIKHHAGAVNKSMGLAVRDGELNQDEQRGLRDFVLSSHKEQFENSVDIDKKRVQKFLIGYEQANFPAEEANSASVVRYPEDNNVFVLLPSSKVPKPLLLEYWKCGRKRRHTSAANAEKALTPESRAENVQVYKCPYCPNYHVGHPLNPNVDRQTSEDWQIRKAAKHWDEHPERCNRFALYKSLI